MSWHTEARCDICGNARKETNGWYRAVVIVAPHNCVPVHFEIHHFNSHEISETQKAIDVCGQTCAQKAFARFLDHGTLEEK